MKTLAVLAAVVVVVVSATPLNTLKAQDGEFVLTKDFSTEDGHEYSVKYVRPYVPGQNVPWVDRRFDDSEEVAFFLASQQGKGRASWSDRLNNLRQVLTTGLDVSDENLRRMYSLGGSKLPADRQYFVDSSGEIYFQTGRKA